MVDALMTPKRSSPLFTALYLLSGAVLAGWFLLLLVGLLNSRAMTLANEIAVPTLLSSVLCLEVFKRLARRSGSRQS
jgi:hypothetical protein